VKSERGVSVLELIIALAIGGVLTLMALPYLQRYMALRDMRQTARLLGADLRLTQQYAVTQNQTFRLQYTAASAQYTLLRTVTARSSRWWRCPPRCDHHDLLQQPDRLCEYGRPGAKRHVLRHRGHVQHEGGCATGDRPCANREVATCP